MPLKERLAPGRVPTEFDKFADTYADLLKDPIRDRFAGSGDTFFYSRKLNVLSAFLKGRGLDPSRLSLLGVGGGKGDFLKVSVSSFRQLAGCDPSEKMLRKVDSASISVRLQQRSTEIPYDSGEFDVLTAICVFHHVPLEVRHKLCMEIDRVLRPNSVMCLIEHNPFNPVTQIIVRRTPVDANAKLLTPSVSRRLVNRAGFTVMRTQHFPYLPEMRCARMGWFEKSLATIPFGGQYAVFYRKVDGKPRFAN
jgi:ubiquinone/menaquinone biosynthesis C-methylase UbiE